VFCSDGTVPIDNNISEREMKRVVLNRKNSLFVGNARGGPHRCHPGQSHQHLPPALCRSATLRHPAAHEFAANETQRPNRVAT
jgi:Transposase IS66 family